MIRLIDMLCGRDESERSGMKIVESNAGRVIAGRVIAGRVIAGRVRVYTSGCERIDIRL